MLRICVILLLLVVPLGINRHSVGSQVPATELMGLDVSHHQHEILWDTVVAKQPLEFAFVKATEGVDFTDSLFAHNWSELARLGVRRGAYHFFRAYGCGLEQAQHFLQTVEMQPGDIAPVLDLESSDGVSKEVLLEEARIWIQTVEQQLGVKPIIYTNLHFYERFLVGAFDDNPLWIARYSDNMPCLSSGKRWDIWQYSNEGCVEGIPKKVDLNMFMGTSSMLERLCWYPAETTAAQTPVESAP